MPVPPDFDSARARLRRLKSGLPQQKIARNNGGSAKQPSILGSVLSRGAGVSPGVSLPAGRIQRVVFLIFCVALFFICARSYIGQKIGVSAQIERVLRAQIGPQLERQLGARVEFGAVETDWLGRVVVRDIIVGRNPKLPLGALARAKSVTLQLDLPGLALGRAKFPDAIRAAALDAPQIYLRRDKSGLNWAKLLDQNGASGAAKWQGHISATNGRVVYFDATVPSASGQPLLLDAREVSADLDTFAKAPAQFTARAGTTYLGANRTRLPAIDARGALESDAKNGLIELGSQGAPFAPLADFAFPKREIIARSGTLNGKIGSSGTLDGRIVFTLRGGALEQHGALALRNLSFFVAGVRDPASNRAAAIDALSGPVEFAGTAFSTTGATFSALGAQLHAAGAVSLAGDSPFDLNLATPALPVSALRRFLPASTSTINFASGAAPLQIHLSGRAAGRAPQVTADGILSAPLARFSDASAARRGAAAFSALRLNFAASAIFGAPRNEILDWKFAARGAAPRARIVVRNQGETRAQNVSFTVRAARSGGMEFGANARDFVIGTPAYGQLSGPLLEISAGAPDVFRPVFSGAVRLQRGQTGAIRLAAISGSLARAVKSSGALDLSARFSGLGTSGPLDFQKLRGDAEFALTRLQLDERAFSTKNEGASAPLLQPADFSLSALRGQIALQNGTVRLSRAGAVSSFGRLRLDASALLQNPGAARIALSLPAASFSAARFAPFLRAQNVALDGDWRGRVSLLSRATPPGNANAKNSKTKNAAPSFGLDFDLSTAKARLRGLGQSRGEPRAGAALLSAPRLQGRAEFAAGDTLVWKGAATLLAREARLQSGILGRHATLPAELDGARADGVKFRFAARSNPSRMRSNRARPVSFFVDSSRSRSEFESPDSTISGSAASFESRAVAPMTPRETGFTKNEGARPLAASATKNEANSTKNEGAMLSVPPLEIFGRLEARTLSAPLPANAGGRRVFLTLRDASADLEIRGASLRIPRFSARYGAGVLAGTARLNGLEGGAARFKLLARDLDIGNLQRLLAPDSRRSARISGAGSALLEIAPGQNPRASVRLSRGAAILVSGGRAAPFSLGGARAEVTALPDGALRVQNAALRFEGARIAGQALLARARWSGNFDVSEARLSRLAALPWARNLADAARPDGLLSGAFSFFLDPHDVRNARLEGRADLRLAEVFGAQIDVARARVSLRNSARGLQISVTDLSGEIEDATVSGTLDADFARDAWSATLTTSGLESRRLARLRALQGSSQGALPSALPISGRNAAPNATKNEAKNDARDAILARALPVTGELGGEFQLSGTLQGARGKFSPRARDGFARFASGPLAWRGRVLGAVRADIEIAGGVARAKTLELTRPATTENETAPVVQISGDLPLDVDSPGLKAEIRVASSPLSFFVEGLQEGRAALRASDLSIPFFERAVAYVDALPEGTTGQVALAASLSGAWRAPRVQVSSLTLRDARTRVPAGGFSPPATLDAAFSLENGAVTIEKAEFKLRKSLAPSSTAASSTVPVEGDESEDDTLLRVEPGASAVPDGPITLAADIFNANLSQLSPWIPALRTSDGAPLLRGELSEFSFRVGGTLLDPQITGSVQGENLTLDNYSLDRLRVSRFEIGNGSARIEPGNLTVVKGAFQSSAAYGRVPWSWKRPGPVMDGLLDVHFPLQTRDFGALVGTFVPALSVADADEFRGSVDVAGTLQAPALSGAITIRGGQFRLDSTKSPLAAGLREVSGTVRFEGGTRLVIDEGDPLRGKLVSAGTIIGRAARGGEIAAREPGREIGAASGITGGIAGGPDPKRRAPKPLGPEPQKIKAEANKQANKNALAFEPKLAGDFLVRGSVERPALIDALLDVPQNPALSREERRDNAARLRALLDPAAALSRLKYDLRASLDGAAFSSPAFGGVSDVGAGVIWKSGEGNAQNVRWMIAARGQMARQSSRKTKGGGALTSFGSLALRRDFGTGIESLARSRAQDFSGEADFAAFAVAKRIDISKFPDRRAQINFAEFASSLTGAGSGALDGRLVLDNGARQQKAPQDALRLQNASIQRRGRSTSRSAARSSQIETDFALSAPPLSPPPLSVPTQSVQLNSANNAWPRTFEIQNRGNADAASRGEETTEIQEESSASGASETENNVPLRLGGVLTLSGAEIYGAPGGSEGTALLLSRLPSAPRFDIRLKIGRDVQIVTSSFRAGLDGELVASGSPSSPQILGVLTTRDGQVRFPNARARVEEGRVSIALTRDPDTDGLRTRVEIDATARGQAGRYAITLRLRGPLDLSGAAGTQNLQIDVSSNPPLSQSEAFEQLLGTVPATEEDGRPGSANRAYASAVLNVLSAPLFSGVEQTLAQTLGLSSVGFEYRFNEALAVQFTKALGDRVFVSYRRSLGSGPANSLASSESNGRTPFELRIEYRLRGNYLLGLQTDERQIPSLTLQKTKRF